MSANPVTNETIRQLSAIRMDELNDARKLAKLPLLEAGERWLETRKPFIDPRTVEDYRFRIRNAFATGRGLLRLEVTSARLFLRLPAEIPRRVEMIDSSL